MHRSAKQYSSVMYRSPASVEARPFEYDIVPDVEILVELFHYFIVAFLLFFSTALFSISVSRT